MLLTVNYNTPASTTDSEKAFIIIIIVIQNLYSGIMPLSGYRGAGGTGR